MSIETEQGYYTTVKMMTTKSFKRRRQIPAEPGWRAVMCEIAGETYTLHLVPLVAWGMTRRGKEPIIEYDGDALMLGELKPVDKFIEEDWVEQAEEAVREADDEGGTP